MGDGTYGHGTIVHTLCGQLRWGHFPDLISIDDPLKRAAIENMYTIPVPARKRISLSLPGRITVYRQDSLTIVYVSVSGKTG